MKAVLKFSICDFVATQGDLQEWQPFYPMLDYPAVVGSVVPDLTRLQFLGRSALTITYIKDSQTPPPMLRTRPL